MDAARLLIGLELDSLDRAIDKRRQGEVLDDFDNQLLGRTLKAKMRHDKSRNHN